MEKNRWRRTDGGESLNEGIIDARLLPQCWVEDVPWQRVAGYETGRSFYFCFSLI